MRHGAHILIFATPNPAALFFLLLGLVFFAGLLSTVSMICAALPASYLLFVIMTAGQLPSYDEDYMLQTAKKQWNEAKLLIRQEREAQSKIVGEEEEEATQNR